MWLSADLNSIMFTSAKDLAFPNRHADGFRSRELARPFEIVKLKSQNEAGLIKQVIAAVKAIPSEFVISD